jgi:hypothetical protein
MLEASPLPFMVACENAARLGVADRYRCRHRVQVAHGRIMPRLIARLQTEPHHASSAGSSASAARGQKQASEDRNG